MFTSGSGEVTKLKVTNTDELLAALKDLNDSKTKTDWVLIDYGKGKNDVTYTKKGEGGLDAFKTELKEDAVQFGVLQVHIITDEYNPIKNALLTWIGPKVPAGLGKARASGHKEQLLDEIKAAVAISAQFVTDKLDEMTLDNISQAITRIRAVYEKAGTVSGERQEMSRSDGKIGTKASQLVIADEEKAKAGLKSVHEGKNDWAILSYIKDKKDHVELVATGTGGADTLREQFPEDRIFFSILRIQSAEGQGILASTVQKIVLLTMIGPKVKPLEKARSSGQRQAVSDFILSVIPFHGHFQPSDKEELSVKTVLAKFK